MLSRSIISKETIDAVYMTLTLDQKEVLDTHIKRGKQTKWLNALALEKGSALTQEDFDNPEEAMRKILDWVLVDYVDGGVRTPDLRCMCGQSLRYRYSVCNMTNGQIVHFSRDHLQDHLKISPHLVKAVVAGFHEIDLEREEILVKVMRQWKLGFSLDGIEVPKLIQLQLDVGLPLLDRQVRILSRLYYAKVEMEKEARKQAVRDRAAAAIYTQPSYSTKTPYGRPTPAQQPKPTGPRWEPLIEEIALQIVELMITGRVNSSAADRLLDTVHHMSRGSVRYRQLTLEEVYDAAQAALAVVESESVRIPLRGIIRVLGK